MGHAVEATIGEFSEALRKPTISLHKCSKLGCEVRVDCAVNILANIIVRISGNFRRWWRQILCTFARRRDDRSAEVRILSSRVGLLFMTAEQSDDCQSEDRNKSHGRVTNIRLAVRTRVVLVHGEFPGDGGDMEISPQNITLFAMAAGQTILAVRRSDPAAIVDDISVRI